MGLKVKDTGPLVVGKIEIEFGPGNTKIEPSVQLIAHGIAKQAAEHESKAVESAAATHKPQLELTEREAYVAELVDLEAKMVELEVAGMLKRKDELRKAILVLSTDADPQSPLVFKTEKGRVEFSACSKEFETDKSALVLAIGSELFNEIAKFGITDLKKILSENELAKVGQYKQGKLRTMKVVL